MEKKLKISGRDALGYLFLGLSVIMLGRSLMLCFSNDIWYDELFTVGMIEHSYGDLIAFTARDVHPPLYYCIVKLVVDLCKLISAQANPVVTAKIVSVLPYFILLLYSVTFIRRRFGIFTGGLFLFCAISMPQLSGYTVEVRMYSWALLFVTAAFLHAHGAVTGGRSEILRTECNGVTQDENRVLNMKRTALKMKQGQIVRTLHAAALVFCGLAAAYTQYFACVAVIMVYLYVLVVFLIRDRGRIKEWLLWVAVSIAGYAPWLYTLFTQITAVNENYWILPLSWRSLGGCVKFLMKPAFAHETLSTVLAVVMFIVYIGVIVCGGIFGYKSRFGIIKKLSHNSREICKKTVCNETESNASMQNDSGQNNNGCNANAGSAVGRKADDTNDTNDTRRDASEQSMKQSTIPAKNKGGMESIYCWNRAGFIAAGIGVLAGLVLFGFAASMLLRPIFVYRYMIPATGCFWLSFAVGLDRLMAGAVEDGRFWNKETGLRGSRFLLLRILPSAITVFVVIIGLRGYRAFMGEEEYKMLLMEQTETALSSIAPDDIVIYNFDQVQAVTSYYLDDGMSSFLWRGTPEGLIQDIIRPYDTAEETEQIRRWCEDGRTVWFIGSFNSRDDIVAEWEEDGLKIEETGSYLLERYWFNLYKVSVSV